MQPYRTLTVENCRKFVTSKLNETVLWLDSRKQLHYMDQQFHDSLITSLLLFLIYLFQYF